MNLSYLMNLNALIVDYVCLFVALIMNGFILPKPSGVRVDYNIMEASLFGWDADTAFIKGWDKAIWSSN